MAKKSELSIRLETNKEFLEVVKSYSLFYIVRIITNISIGFIHKDI